MQYTIFKKNHKIGNLTLLLYNMLNAFISFIFFLPTTFNIAMAKEITSNVIIIIIVYQTLDFGSALWQGLILFNQVSNLEISCLSEEIIFAIYEIKQRILPIFF